MADIHVLLSAEGGGSIRVAFHFPVPDTNNDVGVNYRTALIASGKGGTSVMAEGTGPGEITTAELVKIAAGEVYEHVRTIVYSGVMSGTSLLKSVRSFYGRDKASVTAGIVNALRYFGYTAASEA